MQGYHERREWTGTPKHLKAMGVHRILAIFYGAITALMAAIFYSSSGGWSGATEILVFLGGIATVHALVALGAARANPLAQGTSALVGILMLFGFPIGTVIGIYLLRNSSWNKSEVEA